MRGALWVLGFLGVVVGGGYAVLTGFAAGMSDAPQSGTPDGLVPGAVLAGVGAVAIAAGFFF